MTSLSRAFRLTAFFLHFWIYFCCVHCVLKPLIRDTHGNSGRQVLDSAHRLNNNKKNVHVHVRIHAIFQPTLINNLCRLTNSVLSILSFEPFFRSLFHAKLAFFYYSHARFIVDALVRQSNGLEAFILMHNIDTHTMKCAV